MGNEKRKLKVEAFKGQMPEVLVRLRVRFSRGKGILCKR